MLSRLEPTISHTPGKDSTTGRLGVVSKYVKLSSTGAFYPKPHIWWHSRQHWYPVTNNGSLLSHDFVSERVSKWVIFACQCDWLSGTHMFNPKADLCSINRSNLIDWLIDLLNDLLIGFDEWLTHICSILKQSLCSITQSIDQLTDRPTNRQTYWPTDRPIDWLVDW